MCNRATREAYGETLVQMASEGLRVVALEADLGASTTLSGFGEVFPQRFFDMGISEQDMMSTAAGLAAAGWVPFTGSFAVFGIGRCYEQVRNSVCYPNMGVKVCPTHAGVTVGEDGATHQMLEDIGMMRALPNMAVLVPADYHSAKAALCLAYDTPGPVYVRLGRHKVPEIYDEGFEAALPLANVLRVGTDVTILACGVEVSHALAAAGDLAHEGVSAEVVDVFSVKPLDEGTILRSVAKTGCAVTCEEHMVRCGMGSAVAELLAQRHPAPMRMVGLDSFGTSGPGDALLDHFGLDAFSIAQAAREVVQAKGGTSGGGGIVYLRDLAPSRVR